MAKKFLAISSIDIVQRFSSMQNYGFIGNNNEKYCMDMNFENWLICLVDPCTDFHIIIFGLGVTAFSAYMYQSLVQELTEAEFGRQQWNNLFIVYMKTESSEQGQQDSKKEYTCIHSELRPKFNQFIGS